MSEGGGGWREEGGRERKSIESNRTETAGTHSQAHYSRHSTYWQNAAQYSRVHEENDCTICIHPIASYPHATSQLYVGWQTQTAECMQ